MSCSRWEELCDAILFHGTLAARLRAPTRFRLLNPPSNGAPQSCEVGYDADKKWLDRGHESIRMEGTEVVHDVDSASAEMEIVRLRAASISTAACRPLCVPRRSGCGSCSRPDRRA